MNSAAPKSWNPRRFDARAFAEAGATMTGEDALDRYERLSAERHADGQENLVVRWEVQGETRPDAAGLTTVWMHLLARIELPLACQRCLAPVVVALEVDRWFRFVADEASAEVEDDDSDEDVLSLEPRPDLLLLVEDELLMSIPLVPMHETCPQPLAAAGAANVGIESDLIGTDRPNPFAALAPLKK